MRLLVNGLKSGLNPSDTNGHDLLALHTVSKEDVILQMSISGLQYVEQRGQSALHDAMIEDVQEYDSR